MQTATANNINFADSAARNAPDEQQREERDGERARATTPKRRQWRCLAPARRIEMLTVAFAYACTYTPLGVCVCVDKYASTRECVREH